MSAVWMKTVAAMFNKRILLRNSRAMDGKNEISDRNFLRDNDNWLLFVAVSTIVSAAWRTIALIIRRGNRPIIIATVNKIGQIIAQPNHHPKDTCRINIDKRFPNTKPKYREAMAEPSRAGILCCIELSSR